MVAEFAYGGYFKGADIRPGVSQIELISQVPLGNVQDPELLGANE
jgi:hypothetical protein